MWFCDIWGKSNATVAFTVFVIYINTECSYIWLLSIALFLLVQFTPGLSQQKLAAVVQAALQLQQSIIVAFSAKKSQSQVRFHHACNTLWQKSGLKERPFKRTAIVLLCLAFKLISEHHQRVPLRSVDSKSQTNAFPDWKQNKKSKQEYTRNHWYLYHEFSRLWIFKFILKLSFKTDYILMDQAWQTSRALRR